MLWVGTSVGLSKFDLLKQNFNHYHFDQGSISSISRNIIWSILTINDIIWVGSNEGLNKYDRESKYNETFTPSIIVNNERRANAIYSLLKKDENTLLLGTDGGMYEFDIRQNTFRVAYPMGMRVSDRTYNFMSDKKGRLWVATREGLHLFDYEKDRYKTLK